MKKKIVLLSIIIFPSLIYFLFELTQANFKKMPYFGPRTLNEKGDTVYYSVPDVYFKTKVNLNETLSVEKSTLTYRADSMLIDTVNYPVYAILFIDSKLKREGYKLQAIYDYVKFKPKDIKQVPLVIAGDINELLKGNNELDSLQLASANFRLLWADLKNREQFLQNTYFKQKPEYVFNYFMVLVDKKRHVRGYYDPTYNAEVKRMIDEYKHLKIRDEYAQTLKQNDIKQHEKN